MLKHKRIIGSTVIMVPIISQVLFSFPFNTPQVKEAKAATRLGLHVTQEELNIWKQRATNGPYKNKGDVSTNSPGDWTRMLSRANAFVASPAADRFAGQVSASCVPRADTFPDMHFALGDKLLNAGFVYLVTGATSYRDAVRTELLAQAGVIGTNFADSTRWCLSEGNDADNFFNAAIWPNYSMAMTISVQASQLPTARPSTPGFPMRPPSSKGPSLATSATCLSTAKLVTIPSRRMARRCAARMSRFLILAVR
jgi:hypothetical protein